MSRPVYEQGAPLLPRERFTLFGRSRSLRALAAEAAIEAVPAYKRSWCEAETEPLRAQLPKLAETLSDGEICEHVVETLEAAYLKNRRRPSKASIAR